MDRRFMNHRMPPHAGRHILSRRQPRVYAAGLLFRLINEVARSDELPPATTLLLCLNAAIFFLPKLVQFLPPGLRPVARAVARAARPQSACLRPAAVLAGGRAARARLLWASFVHVGELHLAYNLSSLWTKGRAIERVAGPATLLGLTAYLGAFAHVLYVAVAAALHAVFGSRRWLDGCVVGFSGVLFGLGVVLAHDRRFVGAAAARSRVLGVPVPRRWAPVAELVLTSVVAPHVSFLGHLCGVLAGLTYVHMPRAVAYFVHAGGWRR